MGWSGFGGADPNAVSSRPKSAGITGTTGNGGLMSSLTGAGRPSSSTQMNNSNGWSAQQQGIPQQQQQMAGAQSNSNTLSYGSLKNRFLSGSSGSGKATGVQQSSAVPSNGVSNGAGKSSSSKLFSLAR